MSKSMTSGLVGMGILVLWSSLFQPNAESLDRDALASFRGGDLYCIGTLIDPAGTGCADCRPNGNNGFVRCSTNGLDMTWQDVGGQNPAQHWDSSEQNCQGNLWTYASNNPTCVGTPARVDVGGCLRQITTITFLGYDFGVHCPP